MIGLLTGIAKNHKRNPILIDVHDVGYIVHVPDSIASTTKLETSYTFYIHTHVRDDALDLYGFMTQSDLDLFELLLTVSGIGPKTALTVIDRGAEATRNAVRQGDVDFFTSVPRLGKKNAQKIIIELKSKLGSLKDFDVMGETEGETKQLMDALCSMGFARNEVVEVLKKLDDRDDTLEQKVRRALQMLGRPMKK